MANMRAILVLEKGNQHMAIPGTDMYRLVLGKGARVIDIVKTPSGHLAIKVDGYVWRLRPMDPQHLPLRPSPGARGHPCGASSRRP
eukprot:8653869-Pyramimonas_sp.AAC.1